LATELVYKTSSYRQNCLRHPTKVLLTTATMYRSLALASLSLFGAARAQQVGTSTAETHPKLSWKTCTGTGGTSCTTKSGSIVLDANWRWTHVTSGYTNCYDGNSWNTTACPDGATCTKNCAVDGADYSGKLITFSVGIKTKTLRYLRYHYQQQFFEHQIRHQGLVRRQHWFAYIPYGERHKVPDVQPRR
jgi:hypothetical protein